jgi:hypothetical protein
MKDKANRFFTRETLFAVLFFTGLLFVTPLRIQAQTVFTPPFKFFDSCEREIKAGEGSVNYWSRPKTGDMHLGVQTTWVGLYLGRTGSGVTYTPNFTGPVRIKAYVNIKSGSADATFAVSRVASITALDSDVFVKLDGESPALYRFRSSSQDTITPGGKDVLLLLFPELKKFLAWLPMLSLDVKSYKKDSSYVVQLDTKATKNIPMRICGGVQSKMLSGNLLPLFSGASARYEAKLVKLTVERR